MRQTVSEVDDRVSAWVLVCTAVLSVAIAPSPGRASPATTTATAPATDSAHWGELRPHFRLHSLDGREVTQASYGDKWLVVYFGYTFCPDVCPTVLIEIGHVLKSLGPMADRIQPVFITVDPARDTAGHLAQYLGAFSPRIVGLRGDAEELKSTARQFHVYYNPRSLGNGDYAVDHSSYLYVVAPDARLVKVLPDSLTEPQLAAELKRLVQGGSRR